MKNHNSWYEKFLNLICPEQYSDDDINKSKVIQKHLGYLGRMLSGSKSNYKGRAIFNANLCTKKRKLWFGDIDLDKDLEKLQSIANELNENIYILNEMDARFENENKPLLDKAVLIVNPK